MSMTSARQLVAHALKFVGPVKAATGKQLAAARAAVDPKASVKRAADAALKRVVDAIHSASNTKTR